MDIVFKLGASIIPADEFPKIKLDSFKHDKKSSLPKDLT